MVKGFSPKQIYVPSNQPEPSQREPYKITGSSHVGFYVHSHGLAPCGLHICVVASLLVDELVSRRSVGLKTTPAHPLFDMTFNCPLLGMGLLLDTVKGSKNLQGNMSTSYHCSERLCRPTLGRISCQRFSLHLARSEVELQDWKGCRMGKFKRVDPRRTLRHQK